MNWLIIVAGGNGERMNLGFNKIFAKIHNLSLIRLTLNKFEKNNTVDKMLISAKNRDISRIKKIITKNNFKKIVAFIDSDNSRQKSTLKVLQWLKNKADADDLVGIHNAVNPFVTDKEINKVFLEARHHRAALLAHPTKDTIKLDNGSRFCQKTHIRQCCWQAQTPQVALYKDLLQAFIKAEEDNFLGTDDTQLLERIGIKAKIVECSRLNYKITYYEDLVLAKQILKIYKNTYV